MPVDLPTSSRSSAFDLPQLRVNAGSWSVCGVGRENNEDFNYIAPTLDLFVVADGMGGHQQGELASRFAVEALADALAGIHEQPHSDETIEAAVHAALEHANCMVLDLTGPDDFGGSPGTTIVCALLFGERLFVTGIGDSRAYLLRNGTLEQLTRDDTLVNLLLLTKTINESEARQHPMRNQLLSAVGINGFNANTDIRVLNVQPGDRLLLCTDGLSDVLQNDQLHVALDKKLSPRLAARELVEQAIELGATDDVTCIIMHVKDVPARVENQRDNIGLFARIRAWFSPKTVLEPS